MWHGWTFSSMEFEWISVTRDSTCSLNEHYTDTCKHSFVFLCRLIECWQDTAVHMVPDAACYKLNLRAVAKSDRAISYDLVWESISKDEVIPSKHIKFSKTFLKISYMWKCLVAMETLSEYGTRLFQKCFWLWLFEILKISVCFLDGCYINIECYLMFSCLISNQSFFKESNKKAGWRREWLDQKDWATSDEPRRGCLQLLSCIWSGNKSNNTLTGNDSQFLASRLLDHYNTSV